MFVSLRSFYVYLLFMSCCSSILYSQVVKINEFMASNSTTIQDPDYNSYGDWIELYNSSTNEFNLKDCYITDDKTNNQKYKFTDDLIIPANGYILIWADDYNTGAHVNFKLSASGEYIGLYDPSLNIIDSLTFSVQQPNISCGRFPDAANDFYLFNPSSPLSTNLESSIFNRLPDPIFSLESGFYTGMPVLQLSCSVEGAKVYYTVDGNIPNVNSTVFQNDLHLASTLVVKAVAIKEGFIKSKVITNTYFINETSDLPIFSISTNPDNFFSDTSGIYVIGTNGITALCSTGPRNWNQDWERPITIEFFEQNKERVFNVETGVKIYGGCTRLYPQKSLAFYFRDEYGYGKLNYRLFPDLKITEYNNFTLRSSGQDWWRTMFRDAFVHTLIRQNTNVDAQAYRPTVMFLNGDYWGIHNLREKLNEHYIEEHFQVAEDNLDLIEYSKGITANNGDKVAYDNMIAYFTNNNLADEAKYNYINSIVDLDEFIDYQICQIYGANADWPGSNTKLWHARDNSVKWRFMIYDMDFTFGGNGNGQFDSNTLLLATDSISTTYPSPTWATLMLRKLLKNTNFRNEFIQRFAARINTTFEPSYVISVIDSIKAMIENEMPKHKLRWPQSASYTTGWDNNVEIMRDFSVKRPDFMRQFLMEYFNITGTYNLTFNINNAQWGNIFVQNINIKDNYVQTLFKNIPVKIKAVSMPGYRFVKWEGASNSTDKEITLSLANSNNISAIFEVDQLLNQNIVINEINYKSYNLFDTGDWVELYNPLETDVDLSGWFITDLSDNTFLIPDGTKINKKEYFVVCQDTVKFKGLYNNFNKFTGSFVFGLGSDEEKLTLSNNLNQTVDEVHYNINDNWQLVSVFAGKTLSLKNPQFDNSLPINWTLSNGYGTPGYLNDTYTKIESGNDIILTDFYLYQNYPNPFNPTTTIRYNLPASGNVKLEIFNTLGQRIISNQFGMQSPGIHEHQINMNNFSSGMYVYSITINDLINNRINSKFNKMILIK
ncbi:MAG: CotH kinase family protein [bacterium]